MMTLNDMNYRQAYETSFTDKAGPFLAQNTCAWNPAMRIRAAGKGQTSICDEP